MLARLTLKSIIREIEPGRYAASALLGEYRVAANGIGIIFYEHEPVGVRDVATHFNRAITIEPDHRGVVAALDQATHRNNCAVADACEVRTDTAGIVGFFQRL